MRSCVQGIPYVGAIVGKPHFTWFVGGCQLKSGTAARVSLRGFQQILRNHDVDVMFLLLLNVQRFLVVFLNLMPEESRSPQDFHDFS